MRKGWIVLLTTVVLLATLGCGILMPYEVPRDCPADSLLVGADAFPGEVDLGNVSSPGIGSAVRTYYTRAGIALQEVYHYGSVRQAERALVRNKPEWFMPDYGYEPSEEISFRSPIAHEYYVACSRTPQANNRPVCSMIARYQEYVVRFLVHLGPGVVEERDVNRMLEDIDRRMAECLAKPLPIAR